MDKTKIAEELVKLAKQLMSVDRKHKSALEEAAYFFAGYGEDFGEPSYSKLGDTLDDLSREGDLDSINDRDRKKYIKALEESAYFFAGYGADFNERSYMKLGDTMEEIKRLLKSKRGSRRSAKGLSAGDGAYMSKSQLKKVAEYSAKLYEMIPEGMDLEDWMRTKISQIADDIGEVYHALNHRQEPMVTAGSFRKRSLVMISDLTDWTAYFADNLNMAKDSTDRSAMESALASGDTITMGKTIVTPFRYLSSDDRRNLNKFGLGVVFDI